MRPKTLLFCFAIIVFTSCSSTKKASHNSGPNFAASVPKSTDDGLSYTTAIVITETTETKGTAAEYEWIKQHYTNYKVKMQALNIQDNKPYDIITIILSDGKELKLYFDISNFYGKF